ncbi:MAG: hypothetical protein ACREDD_12195 [Methylocella sp.]
MAIRALPMTLVGLIGAVHLCASLRHRAPFFYIVLLIVRLVLYFLAAAAALARALFEGLLAPQSVKMYYDYMPA